MEAIKFVVRLPFAIVASVVLVPMAFLWWATNAKEFNRGFVDERPTAWETIKGLYTGRAYTNEEH